MRLRTARRVFVSDRSQSRGGQLSRLNAALLVTLSPASRQRLVDLSPTLIGDDKPGSCSELSGLVTKD